MKITISGNEINLRHAIAEEIDTIKKLFDQHKNELGFVVKSALTDSIKRKELLVAIKTDWGIVGVVHYRHRKDGQTTLYSIVVDSTYRLKSIGRALLCELRKEAISRGQKSILLKCPTELEANKFYEAEHFSLITTDLGKHRRLNVWTLHL